MQKVEPMSKAAQEKKPIEIVVSYYWPTKIIKTVSIRNPNESYGHSITLTASDARYVYDQLKDLYEPDQLKQLAGGK